MSIISGSAAISTTGSSDGSSDFYDFPIGQSLMFDGSSSYLSRSQTAGNTNTMTYSLWVKRVVATTSYNDHLLYDGANTGNAESSIYFQGEKVMIEYYHGPSSSHYRRSKNLFRDFSAWYHLVFVINTSNNTAADRFKS